MADEVFEQRFGRGALADFKAKHHNASGPLLDGVDRVLAELTDDQINELAGTLGLGAALDAAAALAKQIGPAGEPESAAVLPADVAITAVHARAALRNEGRTLAAAARDGDQGARDKLTALTEAATPEPVED